MGDIVLFQNEKGRWLLHRVIQSGPSRRLLTRGDAAFRADEDLRADRIRGKATALQRGNSGKIRRLDSARSRRRNFLIALLSRGELKIAGYPLLRPLLTTEIARRALRFPKWILARLLFG